MTKFFFLMGFQTKSLQDLEISLEQKFDLECCNHLYRFFNICFIMDMLYMDMLFLYVLYGYLHEMF